MWSTAHWPKWNTNRTYSCHSAVVNLATERFFISSPFQTLTADSPLPHFCWSGIPQFWKRGSTSSTKKSKMGFQPTKSKGSYPFWKKTSSNNWLSVQSLRNFLFNMCVILVSLYSQILFQINTLNISKLTELYDTFLSAVFPMISKVIQ